MRQLLFGDLPQEAIPSGMHSNFSILGPIRTLRIPLIIARAAAVFKSPPRLPTMGVARASVKLLAAKDRLRLDEIPMAEHNAGYPEREPTDVVRLGITMAKKWRFSSSR